MLLNKYNEKSVNEMSALWRQGFSSVSFHISAQEQCLAHSSDCPWRKELYYWSKKQGDLLFTVNSCTLGILYHVHLSPIQKMNKINKTKHNTGSADKPYRLCVPYTGKGIWHMSVCQVDIKMCMCTSKYPANTERKRYNI